MVIYIVTVLPARVGANPSSVFALGGRRWYF
jgi:hypothetical protein